MIEIVEASKMVEAPAADKFEFFERMALYVGSIIRFECYEYKESSDVTNVAELVAVRLLKDNSHESHRYLIFDLRGIGMRRVSIETKVSALLDGSWKVIQESSSSDSSVDDSQQIEDDDEDDLFGIMDMEELMDMEDVFYS